MRRCPRLLHDHACAGNREAGRIADQAGEFGVLREQGSRSQQSETQTNADTRFADGRLDAHDVWRTGTREHQRYLPAIAVAQSANVGPPIPIHTR